MKFLCEIYLRTSEKRLLPSILILIEPLVSIDEIKEYTTTQKVPQNLYEVLISKRNVEVSVNKL